MADYHITPVPPPWFFHRAYPYLVIAGGQAGYDACVAAPSDGYFSDQCGGMIPNSIANYPRAINVYINGRAGQAQFAGYSSQPLLTNSPINGHISIAMCEFDSGESPLFRSRPACSNLTHSTHTPAVRTGLASVDFFSAFPDEWVSGGGLLMVADGRRGSAS